jgi:hypothetical protein
LTKAIEHTGVSLISKDQILSLVVGTTEILFDTVYKHGSGRLLGIEIHPTPNHIAANAQTLDINVVHDMFGHPNSQVLAATAAKYGFHTKSDFMFAPTVPSAKLNRITYTNILLIRHWSWEGELVLIFPASRIHVMEEQFFGF